SRSLPARDWESRRLLYVNRLAAIEEAMARLCRRLSPNDPGWFDRREVDHPPDLDNSNLPLNILDKLRELWDVMTLPGRKHDLLSRPVHTDRALLLCEETLALVKASKAKGAPTDLPWDGQAWNDLMPQTRRLLQYMHGREQAAVADVIEN